ncbi:hypothetical protein V5799_015020 [Amblyomma americanum]|uniref:Uncharacterized protein n=1 Tax=Amblyomma americanum TaxID=6943 RepID=A0AAQ4E1C5_AMBAM
MRNTKCLFLKGHAHRKTVTICTFDDVLLAGADSNKFSLDAYIRQTFVGKGLRSSVFEHHKRAEICRAWQRNRGRTSASMPSLLRISTCSRGYARSLALPSMTSSTL